MATTEQIKTLAQNREPVNFTMSAIPFEIWKAVMDESTMRRCAAKQIWIEAVSQYLNLPPQPEPKPAQPAA